MKKYLLAPILVLITLCSYAQESKPVLNFSTADAIVKGCIEYAEANKVRMAIAVYNDSGVLIAFAKMDGVPSAIVKVAQWKGISAATYQAPSSETASWNVPTAPDIATVPGGLPLKAKDGTPLGGVGVSGAASSVDVQCATAGLKKAGLN
jgi:glc operon protein GlcG